MSQIPYEKLEEEELVFEFFNFMEWLMSSNHGRSIFGRRFVSENDKLKTEMMKPIYKFCPNKIEKLVPEGNRRKGTECPKARSGHRIVADSGNIYSIGGYNPNTRPDSDEELDDEDEEEPFFLFKELWKYNLASRCWIKLDTNGNMPEELASHAAVLVNDYLIVFGGTIVPFGFACSNNVHVCNLSTLHWSYISTTGPEPSQQYGQAVMVNDNKLYVVGGTNGLVYSIGVHSLDFVTKEWKSLDVSPWQPEKRYRHEIAIHDQQLFVFGGGTAFECFGFKEIPVFCLEKNCWKSVLTHGEWPAARRCHGCVQMGSAVYISGGYDGQVIYSDVWKMDLKTLQWTKLPANLTTPVYFHSATLSPEGQMFIFGGVTNIDNSARSNELFSIWLKVPTLADISWQAILHYAPHVAETCTDDLLEVGIPRRFLDQICVLDEDSEDDFVMIDSVIINSDTE